MSNFEESGASKLMSILRDKSKQILKIIDYLYQAFYIIPTYMSELKDVQNL